MHLAELPPPSRLWLAALPFALLAIPRGGDAPIVESHVTVIAQAAPSPCDDPYPGVWVARSHRNEHCDWHEYTIEIRRNGGELSGVMSLRAWPGPEDNPLVPECPDGTRMVARFDDIPVTLTVDGKHIRIDAGRARAYRHAACNPVDQYSPDHFVGTFDGEHGTMDVANTDDGGWAHERPYEFVRMTCNQ